MARLYAEAIASRLFDAPPIHRLERSGTAYAGDSADGFAVVSGSHRRTFAWTANDWEMRDLKDETWNRLDHFKALLDSTVHADPAYQALPPSYGYAM